MAQLGAPRHDPIPIGDAAAPPFTYLPDLNAIRLDIHDIAAVDLTLRETGPRRTGVAPFRLGC